MFGRFLLAAGQLALKELKAIFHSRSQTRTIIKLNLYQLSMINRENQVEGTQSSRILLSLTGYCSGMTSLWLDFISKGQEEDFYKLLDKIHDCPINQMSSEEYAPAFEKLISYLEWGQNPELYVAETDTTRLEEILDVESIYENSIHKMATKKLSELLSLKINQNKLIYLRMEAGYIGHAIGLYCRDNTFYLFDPSDTKGRHKEFTDVLQLAKEIERCLFLDKNKSMNTKAQIKVYSKKPSRFQKIILKQQYEEKNLENSEFNQFYANYYSSFYNTKTAINTDNNSENLQTNQSG